MMKNSLAKMNAAWETTAMLMGDSWMKTIFRVVTPNALPTVLEVFSYYFVNAMVTVSAVIFIAGARTMVITTKIKELQYFEPNSTRYLCCPCCILFTNCAAKLLFQAGRLARRPKQRESRPGKPARRMESGRPSVQSRPGSGLTAVCGGRIRRMAPAAERPGGYLLQRGRRGGGRHENALDENGYKGKYMFQTFGTSELGGKLLAEGTDIEADLVTMSTFYLDSAQEQNEMFLELNFDAHTLEEMPAFYRPITSQEGAIIFNTAGLREPAHSHLPEGSGRPGVLRDRSP